MSAAVEHNQPSLSSRVGLRRLFSNASARDISRALVRREGSSATDTTRLSVLGHGQDTRIRNSTVNTTVNYHYTVRSPPESNTTDVTPEQSNVQPANDNSSVVNASPPPTTIDSHSISQSSTTEQPKTPRDARDVYVDIMITKNRGFPLWIPSPNTSLPPEYRYSGVSIGDVGVLTPEGGFDFIFNIFADAGDPINAHSGLTDTFSPLRPPLRPFEVQRFKENIAGTLVGDDSFERTDNIQDVSKVILTTQSSEAAVLLMPEDAFVVKIQNQERLRTYVGAHIVSWYAFVRRTLGRDISNGDLRVVYGYRKSTAFGIAAVSTAKKPNETRLTFGENESWARQSGYKYRWSQVGSADIKTGPEYGESAELMYPAYGTSRTLPENQCLFISTVDTKLSKEAWRSIEVIPVLGADATHSESPPSPSRKPENHHLGYTDGSSGGNPSAAPSMEMYALNVLSKQPFECQPINHPSSILNDVLLKTNPEAYISIVCDDDWEGYMQCQDPLEFVSAILCHTRVVIKNNVLCLEQPKTRREHHPLLRTLPDPLVSAFLPLPDESHIDHDKLLNKESEAKTSRSMYRPRLRDYFRGATLAPVRPVTGPPSATTTEGLKIAMDHSKSTGAQSASNYFHPRLESPPLVTVAPPPRGQPTTKDTGNAVEWTRSRSFSIARSESSTSRKSSQYSASIRSSQLPTPEGRFDILHIFASAGDPVHSNPNSGLMHSFSPLRPPLRHYGIRLFIENAAGTSVPGDSFERMYNIEDES